MNENLNLVEKLKNIPAGTVFYTTTRGNCEFCRISNKNIIIKIVDCSSCFIYAIDKFGRLGSDGECIIFPSKDQRDWDKFILDPIKIGTPCMVRNFLEELWTLEYYAGEKCCYRGQRKDGSIKRWLNIIPVSDFDFENLCRKGEEK